MSADSDRGASVGARATRTADSAGWHVDFLLPRSVAVLAPEGYARATAESRARLEEVFRGVRPDLEDVESASVKLGEALRSRVPFKTMTSERSVVEQVSLVADMRRRLEAHVVNGPRDAEAVKRVKDAAAKVPYRGSATDVVTDLTDVLVEEFAAARSDAAQLVRAMAGAASRNGDDVVTVQALLDLSAELGCPTPGAP